jgi:ammonium transporter Rh
MKRSVAGLYSAASMLLLLPAIVFAQTDPAETGLAGIRLVQQYNFSIHILAMLLVGFGFIFVFVRNYGYGATTATYILVGIGLPLYMFLRAAGPISAEAVPANTVKCLLLAEFAVASALIAMGAVLGRMRMYQYAILIAVFVPAYMINEWLVLDGGLGVTKGFVDAAGSIVLHAFGAYFGLGMSVVLTNEMHRRAPVESDATSDRFSMLGSMVFWLFWPSFCCALVPFAQFEQTAINTVLALCGSTVVTAVLSAILRKGKISIGDMANAALAGGVAIGATCNLVSAPAALLIGAVAGAICTIGFFAVQPWLLRRFKILDSAGVHNLHGMCGLFGGIAVIVAVPTVAKAMVAGIIATLIIAWASGSICGFIIRAAGRKKQIALYQDAEDFIVP